ncbi:MAG: hypothetical protein GWN62_37805 [Aliifodinibius sp.]|nr:hypothetical protein [Fodinibius sp.]
MAQYVLEIRDSDGWLARSFEVTDEHPVPETPDEGCTQVVMTNSVNYNEIFSIYNQYTTTVAFSYDEPEAKINCSGAYTGSWDIN